METIARLEKDARLVMKDPEALDSMTLKLDHVMEKAKAAEGRAEVLRSLLDTAKKHAG